MSKQYLKHHKYLKYLLILYQKIQINLIYMLSLGILAYAINYSNLYVTYYNVLNFEKFKAYNGFKIFKKI